MWAWPDLTHRSESQELMDDLSIGGAELAETLAQLRWINRLLGAAWPTLEGVNRLWRLAGRPVQLSILDVGAGSGDINRRLLSWATRRHIRLNLTLVDIHPDTCTVATAYYRDEPRVQVQQGDIFQLAAQQADIVTASLFLHHFPAAQVPDVLQAMLHAARLGVVINDLHRHWLAWAGILAATRLLSRNRLIRHDAPLSVRRGFRSADFRQLQELPKLTNLTYAWRPFFRYLVIISTAAVASRSAHRPGLMEQLKK
ncbi:MAG: methyltransferase domain-containing protein [Anaerolineae bacterium]|nr:methyltransferase domain-containing protein [Anaerolineae bacterium]